MANRREVHSGVSKRPFSGGHAAQRKGSGDGLQSHGEKKSRWSARSQKSQLEEVRLKKELAGCQVRISLCQKAITEGEEKAARLTSAAASGRALYFQNLPDTLNELEGRRKELAAFEAHSTTLRSQIADLRPSASEAAERAKHQNSLAKLARQRLHGDREISSVVEKLRGLLNARHQLTDEMIEVAGKIDFSFKTGALDESRFDGLLDTLADDVAAGSEQWISWFFGQEKGKKPYTVGKELFVLPETLASENVFRSNARVHLTADQARQLEETTRAPLPAASAAAPASPNRRSVGHLVFNETAPDGIVA